MSASAHLFENPKVADFAARMHKVPRKMQRCEVYGTTSVIVDRNHAGNILRKVFPTVSSSDVYQAVVILQDRLDERG